MAKRSSPTEHEEQAAYSKWVRAQAKKDWRYGNIFSIPNSGARSFGALAWYKAEGMAKGVPDIFVAIAAKGHHGLFIEMKRMDGGYEDLSKEQIAWSRRLSKAGYTVVVAFGAMDAIRITRNYLEAK